MNICILTHNTDIRAGWGRYSDLLASSLRKRGHHIVVLTEREGEHPILRRRLGIFFSALRAVQYFWQADIIHALDVYPFGIIAWLANIITRKPLVITAQGTYSIAPLKNRKIGWLARAVCSSADAIIAISKYTASRILDIVPDGKITIINHGIDFSQYPPPHDRATCPHRVISVGALKWRKGYHISLEAFAIARRQMPNLEYIIVGSQRDVGYTKQLCELISKLHIADAVTFLENLSDDELGRAYSEAGLFLLTSVNQGDHFEGFGLVFLEAAAYGLPVIGTTDNGISDAISSGVNGILVPQNDIQRTADAIVSILADSHTCQKMSGESLRWAKAHDMLGVAPRYEEVYKNVS